MIHIKLNGLCVSCSNFTSCGCRNGQKLVDETMSKINSLVDKGQLTPDRYHFIGYLMGRDTLSFREVSIITLSLFNDGLKTVRSTPENGTFYT